jgi:hypothetical protein
MVLAQTREYDNPADRPEPKPPQPAGASIGRRDSLMNALRPELAEWVTMWRAAIPGFKVDSLYFVDRHPWKIVWEELPPTDKHAPWYPWDDQISAQVLTITSRDSAFELWIDADQSIDESDSGEIVIGGEPDSRSELIDRHGNRSVRIFDAGTGAGAHWGHWFGSRRVALAGWSNASDYGHWNQGWISIYSIPDSSITRYVTRIIPWDKFRLYSAEWEKWIAARYRTLKRRASK